MFGLGKPGPALRTEPMIREDAAGVHRSAGNLTSPHGGPGGPLPHRIVHRGGGTITSWHGPEALSLKSASAGRWLRLHSLGPLACSTCNHPAPLDQVNR